MAIKVVFKLFRGHSRLSMCKLSCKYRNLWGEKDSKFHLTKKIVKQNYPKNKEIKQEKHVRDIVSASFS